MFKKMLDRLTATVSPGGPSSTKMIYVATGGAGIFGALLMTITFCVVYAWKGLADPSFATAVAGIWVAAYGFVTSAHNQKNTADKEIELAKAGTTSTTVETKVDVQLPSPPPPGGP